jgi:hypothetical protein
LVEQRTENPRVGGSIPSLGTTPSLRSECRTQNEEFRMKKAALFSILRSAFFVLHSGFDVVQHGS